jgi:GAF domain-containing protein
MDKEKIYAKAYESALQLADDGRSSTEILAYLTQAAECAAGDDTTSSILLLDDEGLLRNGASPGLPLDYLKAIDGLKPAPNVGTCAAAAATGSVVVTRDFYEDDKWAELRHLPSSLGFKGAWSMPIINKNGMVLGTFGTYFSKHRAPTDEEIEGVRLLASAVASVLSKS